MRLYLVSFVLTEDSVARPEDNTTAISDIHKELNTIYPELAVIKVAVTDDVPEDNVSERTVALLSK